MTSLTVESRDYTFSHSEGRAIDYNGPHEPATTLYRVPMNQVTH